MQFTISTIALVASMMAAQAEGSPIPGAGNMCNTTPSAAGTQKALESPTASTGAACKNACSANAACKSFAFGLPPNAQAPVCKLFPVAGAQVTAQATNVKVFDLGCTDVSAQPPTAAHPVGPLRRRGQVCGAAPTGGAGAQPLLAVSVGTAEQCQAAARKESGCQSFTFGLPADADAPLCRLFAVPAAQAPAQEANLVAFDLGCDSVPTTQPTRAQPVGLLDLSVSLNLLQGSTTQSATGQKQGEAQKQQGDSSNSSNSGKGSTATSGTAASKTSGYPTQNVASAQSDSTSQVSTNNSQKTDNSQQPGTSYPTSSDGKSTSNSNAAGSSSGTNRGKNSNGNGNSNSYPTQALAASQSTTAKKCGVAPVGAATSAPAPLKSDGSVLTVDACLALGKATSGCLSVQFGRTAAGGAQECRLFGVSASVLPAVGGDENAVVYDVAC